MNKFIPFESRLVPLAIDNIDTDQIIPARFLKTISKDGLGDQLFYDWRYDAEGNPKPDFILNSPEAKRSQILLAGDNFGCGSSREHAPWALTQYGFRAVISTSFADIFKQNSLKNSLLPIIVPRDVHAELFAKSKRDSKNRSRLSDVDATQRPSNRIPGRRLRQALPARRHRRARLHPATTTPDRSLREHPPRPNQHPGIAGNVVTGFEFPHQNSREHEQSTLRNFVACHHFFQRTTTPANTAPTSS